MIAHLYCAIPTVAEADSYPRTAHNEWRRCLRLAYGFVAWRLFKTFRFASYDASNFSESNVGDIAIRLSVENIIRQRLESKISDIIEDKWGNINASYHLHKTERKKLIVIAGSGYLFLEDDGGFPDRIRSDLKCFSECKAGDKVVALGIGMNRPGASRETTRLDVLSASANDELRQFCKLVSVIGVRDEATRAAIMAAAPDASPIVVADPALFLAPAPDPTIARRPGAPRVSLNLPFHGPLATEILRTRLADFGRLLTNIQNRFNVEFSYMQHHDAECILPSLLRELGLRIDRVYHGSPERLIHGYADQDLHIGHMLHSCILAASSGVAPIGLAYDNKSFGFFELMNMPENCIHYSECNEDWLAGRVESLLANRDVARRRLIDRRTALWNEWEMLLQQVDRCIVA